MGQEHFLEGPASTQMFQGVWLPPGIPHLEQTDALSACMDTCPSCSHRLSVPLAMAVLLVCFIQAFFLGRADVKVGMP